MFFNLIFRLRHATIERLKDDASSVSSKGSIDNKLKAMINIETANSQESFIDDSIENMLADGQDIDERDGQGILNLSTEVAEILGNQEDRNQDDTPLDDTPLDDTESFKSDSDSEREPAHIEVESISNECNVSRQFIDLLFSTVHIKGESRLAQEVIIILLDSLSYYDRIGQSVE